MRETSKTYKLQLKKKNVNYERFRIVGYNLMKGFNFRRAIVHDPNYTDTI